VEGWFDMAFKDIAKSGVLGLGPALVADNPKLLQGMGLVGNLAYNKIEDREDKKRRDAEAAAMGAPVQPGMKKGGSVKSASARADGCAIKGKTKGRMV
jgi:hypothetical protein